MEASFPTILIPRHQHFESSTPVEKLSICILLNLGEKLMKSDKDIAVPAHVTFSFSLFIFVQVTFIYLGCLVLA